MAEDELERMRSVFSRRIDYMLESAGGGLFGGLVFVFLVHLVIGVGVVGATVSNLAIAPFEWIGLLLSLAGCLLSATFFFGLAMVLGTMFVDGLNWSFGYILSTRHAVIVTAGLSGFVFGTIPFVFILIQNSVFQNYMVWESLLLVFPVFATVVCSISAAWHESRYTRRYFGKNFEDTQGLQLNIRHLLAGMLWISLLMAFSTGIIGNHWPVILFFVFVSTQGFVLLIDSQLQSWKRSRRQRRAAKMQTVLNSK